MNVDWFRTIRSRYERLAEQNPNMYVRVFINQKSGAGTSFCLNSNVEVEYGFSDLYIYIYEPAIPSYYFVEVEDIESVSISFIKKT